MGCVCCSLSSFVSIVLDAFERVSMCTVCALLTCCLLFTILSVLIMGIGIGFHYCFVTEQAESMARAAKASRGGHIGRSGPEKGNVMRSLDKMVSRGHRLGRREIDFPTTARMNNETLWLQQNYTIYNLTRFLKS